MHFWKLQRKRDAYCLGVLRSKGDMISKRGVRVACSRPVLRFCCRAAGGCIARSSSRKESEG